MDNINVIEVYLDGEKIGRIATTPDYLCAFQYDADYLTNGHSISPYELPLKPNLFIGKRTPFKGNFGVFDDSLPDGWGNLILDRYLLEKGEDPAKLSILQRLALVGSTGRGALEYRPDFSTFEEDARIDFDRLAQEAGRILQDVDGDVELLEDLYKYGGSSGGARPKVFAARDGKQWLVKFKATMDPNNIGEIEYQYSLLAKECGIRMPETRLFEGRYFGVERFDRTLQGKIHTVSAAGLLNADYRIPSLDYSSLLKLCYNLTKDIEQVYDLFRLMVFNVTIKNRDDHAKNFSFQLLDGQWKLSPAYDILPSTGFNGYHTTTINGKGEPSDSDMLAVGMDTGLTENRCKEIMVHVRERCRNSSF